MTFVHAWELGVDTGLKEPLLAKMCEANMTFWRWQGAAAMQKQVEEEQVQLAAQVEKSASEVTPPPKQHSAKEPPATQSPSEAHESASSTGQKRKVSPTYDLICQ